MVSTGQDKNRPLSPLWAPSVPATLTSGHRLQGWGRRKWVNRDAALWEEACVKTKS